MFSLIILAGLLTTVQSGVLLQNPISDVVERIVGGDIIRIKDAPYQVSVQKGGIHVCGGTLISDRFVLTAAHCFIQASTYGIQVRIGSSLKNSGGLIVEVSQMITHELYNRLTTDYDFALLKLVAFNKTELIWGSAQLPNQNRIIADGSVCTVTGWGRTQGLTSDPDSLRAVNVVVYNQNYCVKVYQPFAYVVTDRMICAGSLKGGKDACQGDSGGPLMINGTLVGVVSWGFECAHAKYPGVYSRVSSVRKWITEITGL